MRRVDHLGYGCLGLGRELPLAISTYAHEMQFANANHTSHQVAQYDGLLGSV